MTGIQSVPKKVLEFAVDSAGGVSNAAASATTTQATSRVTTTTALKDAAVMGMNATAGAWEAVQSFFNTTVPNAYQGAVDGFCGHEAGQPVCAFANDAMELHAAMHPAVDDAINTTLGVGLLFGATNLGKAYFNEGPELAFANQLSKGMKGLEKDLKDLQVAIQNLSAAREEVEASKNDTEKQGALERQVGNISGRFEAIKSKLDMLKGELNESASTRPTDASLRIKMGEGESAKDLLVVFDDLKKSLVSWVDDQLEDSQTEATKKFVETSVERGNESIKQFSEPLNHAMNAYREAHPEVRHGKCAKVSLAVSAAVMGAGGAFLVVRDGVMGLGGHLLEMTGLRA